MTRVIRTISRKSYTIITITSMVILNILYIADVYFIRSLMTEKHIADHTCNGATIYLILYVLIALIYTMLMVPLSIIFKEFWRNGFLSNYVDRYLCDDCGIGSSIRQMLCTSREWVIDQNLEDIRAYSDRLVINLRE